MPGNDPEQTVERMLLSLEDARILVALLGPIAPIPGSANLYERLLKFAYPTGRSDV